MRLALFSFGLLLFGSQTDDQTRDSKHANDLMAAGRYEQAIPIYRRLVDALPGNTGLLLNLALAEHMAGREREAIPHLEAVLKSQPNLMPALLSLGAARLALNEPQAAIAPLQRVVKADPKNRDARGMLAGALLDAGRFEQAAGQYRELATIAPDDPRAWYGLGMSYQSYAGEIFERMQKANPQSPYVSALIADTRVQRRQYRSAFFFYSEALKQLPNLRGVHAAMAELYRKTGHPEWAEQEDAKERSLPEANCSSHPGECEFAAGHDLQLLTAPARSAAPSPEMLYWQAKAANELALQSFFRLGQLPPSIELHRLKAEIARAQNQHLDAVQEWRAALTLSPGNPSLGRELAISLLMATDYRAALAQAVELLKSEPRDAELNFIAGESELRLEEPGKAVPYLQAAIAADPKLLPAEASLGLALGRLGKNAEAIPRLEKSLAMDEDGSLHYQLVRAYQAVGEQEKAKSAMAKYQEILRKSQETKAEIERETQISPPKD